MTGKVVANGRIFLIVSMAHSCSLCADMTASFSSPRETRRFGLSELVPSVNPCADRGLRHWSRRHAYVGHKAMRARRSDAYEPGVTKVVLVLTGL